MRLPDDPSVLVLLVATDGEAWLPEVLKGLRAQGLGSLKVLAVDNASTDASPRILRKAFGPERVITLERRVGYGRALAAALQVASERQVEADAVLLLHDDAALRSGALAAMIRTLRGDGVGIVGAKLVEWADERVLQEIGRTTDRYGRIFERVERGELDQGQHEGIHEVLYATSAAMLIATEVIEKVGLFDLRFVALRDDLDLCWRARLAGYRTVVTTDATARHASAMMRDERPGPVRKRVRYFGDRNMMATMIKNYSGRRLVVALPVTLLVSVINIVLYAARGRRSSAAQVLEALRWNMTHLPSTIRARRRAQAARSVSDVEVASLMHHGATRVRAQIERAIESIMGEVEEITEADLEAPPERLIDRIRAHPTGVAVTLAMVVGLLGARPLLGSGAVAGIDMAPWPSGFAAFFQEYASGWRGIEAGGAGPATPGLMVLGALTLLTFGSGWLAQRALLFGLPVLGAIGMIRLAARIGLGAGGRRVAAMLYAISPLMLGAFGDGRLPDLVLVAAGPWLLIPLLRSGGVMPRAGWRSTAAGAAGAAVVTSLSPWAPVFVASAAIALALSRAGTPRAIAVLRRAAIMVLGALALLLPWSIELFRPGSPVFGGGPGPARGMADLLALAPSLVRPVPVVLSFGLAITAVAGGLLAPKGTRKAVGPLTALAALSLLAAWLVARGVPWVAPRPGLPLVGVAVAFAILSAFAYQAAAASLGTRTFGGPHVLAGVIGLVLAIQLGGSLGWIAGGDRLGLVPADTLSLASLTDEEAEAGTFRVLWLGGSADRPSTALAFPGGETMRRYLTRDAGAGHDVLASTVAAILAGSTDHGGRLLATFGVRFVVVRPEADAVIRLAVASQPDLTFVQRLRPPGEQESIGEDSLASGALVYRNASGFAAAARLDRPGWIRASRGALDALSAAEPDPGAWRGLHVETPGVYRGTLPGGEHLLLAEDHSSSWRARVGETDVSPERSFGWANRFALPDEGGDVVVWYAGQRWHRGAVLLNALLIAAFVTWRSMRIARDRGER